MQPLRAGMPTRWWTCSRRRWTSRRLALDQASRREVRSEEHTSELQSRLHLVCRLLLEKKKKRYETTERLHLGSEVMMKQQHEDNHFKACSGELTHNEQNARDRSHLYHFDRASLALLYH